MLAYKTWGSLHGNITDFKGLADAFSKTLNFISLKLGETMILGDCPMRPLCKRIESHIDTLETAANARNHSLAG